MMMILCFLLVTVRFVLGQTTPHPDIRAVVPVPGYSLGESPRASWVDSYSIGDRCYCDSNFDHGIADFLVETPAGWASIGHVCALLGPGPGWRAGYPRYNDIQCGNGPPNNAGDEHTCPGRCDIGNEGCGHIGPKWNFDGVDWTNLEGCYWVDSRYEANLDRITDGGKYDLSSYYTAGRNIYCLLSSGVTVPNVTISMFGPMMWMTNSDAGAPYTLCGRRFVSGNVNYYKCFEELVPGSYTLQVTPFEKPMEIFHMSIVN